MELFVQGDDDAFTRLVDLAGARLFGFICRFVGDRHLAEDVYQDVWVKVAKHAQVYDRRARFSTWLYRIARNTCLDAMRYHSRRRMSSLQNGDEDEGGNLLQAVESGVADPGDQAAATELGHRITRAVEQLPDEQREVFLLKEHGRITFDEIGDLLGCGKETAKSRMRYALKRLQSILGQEGRLYGLLDDGS